MRRPLALLVLAAGIGAQGHGDRRENETTLGLVVYERDGKVVVHEALAGGPAAKAGVRPGDVIRKAGPKAVERHNDVDAALRKWPKGRKIELDLVRGRKKLSLLLEPAADLDHPYRKAASKEATGFEAPEWHAFGWVNVPPNGKPPTRALTKGRVVVIHCFQAWSPGCLSWSFPVHRRVEQEYAKAADVVHLHLQTVWEGQHHNLPEANERMVKQFELASPVGYDAHVDGARLSIFARQYSIGGTPWTVVIGKDGKVVFNAVTPKNEKELFAVIEKARATARDE